MLRRFAGGRILLQGICLVASSALLSTTTLAQDGGRFQSGAGTLGPAEVHDPGEVPDVPQPPRDFFEEPEHDRGMPPLPQGAPNGLPQPDSPPTRVAGRHLDGPCDTRFWTNRPVTPSGARRSQIGEPTACQARDTAFYTGNWHAARSIDQGRTWTHINPFTRFPRVDSGFCCDQWSLYVPSHDITVWILQYGYSSSTQRGSDRIAVSRGRNGLRAGSGGAWHSWVLNPRSVGRPRGEWFDFPHVAFTRDHFFLATNIFDGASRNFRDAVVMRFPLSTLRSGGNLGFRFIRRTMGNHGGASYRLAHWRANAPGSVMYYASHISTSRMRVYRWSDGSTGVSWNTRNVPSWSNGPYNVNCRGSNNNVGGRMDGRIRGAYATPSEYGFAWASSPQSNRPRVFVRWARFNRSNHNLINVQDTWSRSLHFFYAAAGVNSVNDVGVSIGLCSIGSFPRTGAFIRDTCKPNFSGQTISTFHSGTNGIGRDGWGDYLSVVQHPNVPRTFIGTGMSMIGGTANRNQIPRFAWFGREKHEPSPVKLTVRSTPITGVRIEVDEADRRGRTDGTTNFTREYWPRQGYTLRAPRQVTSGGKLYFFRRWTGTGGTDNDPVYTVSDIGRLADTARAEYTSASQCFHMPGNTPGSGRCNVIPFGTTPSSSVWRNQRYQTFMTAKELDGRAREICSLGFSPCGSTKKLVYEFDTIEVRMGRKRSGSLGSNFAKNYAGRPVTVFRAEDFRWPLSPDRWNDLPLQKAFSFNGSDDLLVEIIVTGAGRVSGKGQGFHRQGPRQRVSAANWTGKPPSSGRVGSNALKMRVCAGVASTSTFGEGCPAGRPLTLSYGGSSKTGSTLRINLGNRPGARSGAVLFGSTNAPPRPVDLSAINMKGCFLFIDVIGSRGVSFSGGNARLDLRIPNDTELLCAFAFNQGVAIDPGATPLGVSASNAGRFVIGN